jgi:acyl-CoA reductase-like NAD-dependent aldehyde dehydrogenase
MAMRSEDHASSNRVDRSGERMPGRPSVADYALLEELSFVRREAQAEANLAYADWRVLPSHERYAVYRAAQDRADAAQDQLANWAGEIGRGLRGSALALQPT